MEKRKGTIGPVISLFFVIFIVIIASYMTNNYISQTVRANTEDALAASNLASAVIDIEEYGTTHNIIIPNPDAAFAIYKDALKVNMDLDDSWYYKDLSVIPDQVVIMDYIIYNVRDNDVEIYYYGQNQRSEVITGGKGTVRAPNGKLIESTSIYSRITFTVNGFMNIQTTAVKDKLVDIVS